jgi:hypothetical protein
MSFIEVGYREDDLVRLDIKINGEDAPPLATVFESKITLTN